MQDEVTLEGYSLTVVHKTAHVEVYTVAEHPGTLVIRAVWNYIPKHLFVEIFGLVYELAKTMVLTTVIFDKRKLLVFNQPSMEWYFLEWKEGMAEVGVTRHRKLLPPYDAFRAAARLAREKLYVEHPDKKFHQLDIRYAESLKEALES
jgi:hypothetical protein